MRVPARGHLSIRPTQQTLELLAHRSKMCAQSRSTLAERYLREGSLMDEYPGIYFVDGAFGRRAAVIGSGLDVWEIVEVVRDNDGSSSEAAAYLEIDQQLVELAMRYYGSNRVEIDDWIARVHAFNEAEESKWRAAQHAAA